MLTSTTLPSRPNQRGSTVINTHAVDLDSGVDLNAYAKIENQSGCCSLAMDHSTPANAANPLQVVESSCCSSSPTDPTLHDELKTLLASYDVNSAAASVKVYAIKPAAKSCCGPTCCS